MREWLSQLIGRSLTAIPMSDVWQAVMLCTITGIGCALLATWNMIRKQPVSAVSS